MERIILAPDSFKGSMSSIQICDIMEKAIKRHFEDAEIIKIPVADGGEGTVDCFLKSVGGKKIFVRIKGPYFGEIDSFYGVLSDGNTAVIEIAAVVGLPLVEDKKDPACTTTYGVGQLIRHAIEHGYTKIIVGIGGSCTNDGGAGMAAALGIKFFDKNNIEFIPTGGTLNRIDRVDITGKLKNLDFCSILAACDVDNPLCGLNGAAYVFAPQKGANNQTVKLLDDNLMHFANIIKRDIGMDIAHIPGAGAAGGLGAGIMVFAGAQLKPGIEIVLDLVNFEEVLEGSNLVITGEGKIDGQSLRGKVVCGIAKQAKVKGIPTIAIVGDIGDDIENIYSLGISAVMSINRLAITYEKAKLRCSNDLNLTVDTLMRIIKLQIS